MLFDAGNTLVFIDPPRALEVLVAFGASDDLQVFADAERKARLHLSRLLASAEPPPEVDAWRAYFANLLGGVGIPQRTRREAGRALWESHLREHLWTRTDPATPEALAGLLDAGFRLGVVSNADGRMPDLLDAVGLARHMEFVVDSHAVGFEKPDPRIFGIAVERMALTPGECVYVGDLYAVDVVGARSAGLRPVLVDPFEGYGDLALPVERIPAVSHLPELLRSP